MKKTVILLLSSALIYSYFRKPTLASVLTVLSCVVFSLLLGKIKGKDLEKVKYLLIGGNLILCLSGLIYPPITRPFIMNFILQFFSISSLLFYLSFSQRKRAGIMKECLPLLIVYLGSSVNLYLIGQLPLLLPFSLAATFYLYVMVRPEQMVFSSIFTLLLAILTFLTDDKLFSGFSQLEGFHRFLLFASSFLLFAISFFKFLTERGENPNVLFAFLGMLAITLDILFSQGISFKYGLFRQPYIASLVVVLVSGMIIEKKWG